MKTLLLLPACCLLQFVLFAQNPDPSMLIIHEDKVLTDKQDAYWAAAAELKNVVEKNKIPGFRFWAFAGDDGSYSYVTPMYNFAELDNDPWKALADKIGGENVKKLENAFNGTYLTHKDYMLRYHANKSYNTESWTEKDVYRESTYYYLYQEKFDEFLGLLDEWKAAFKDANTAMGYQVYSTGIGMDGPVVIVMTWGESEIDEEQDFLKSKESLKEKWNELWKKTKPCVYKIETRKFWFVPELTYFPAE